MTEFSDTQTALTEARKQRNQTNDERFLVAEKLRKIKRRYDERKRRVVGDDDDQLAELKKQAAALEQSAERLDARIRESERLLLDQEKLFEVFTDPTEHVARLSDRYPILLFPVRIETRFKQLSRDDRPVHELWVRVYPDDIAVDTFEPVLAEVEVSNARIYWTNIWKAGGDEGLKRAAWQSLVKSHGDGRAYWIIDQVQPTNAAEEPVKSDGDHLLVIVTQNPLPATEKPAVEAYWRSVYAAAGDQTALDAAFDALVGELGATRAAVIQTEYEPQNLHERLEDPDTVFNVRVVFLELPVLDDINTQQQPWMHAAKTSLLPERFVLLGFNQGKQTLKHIGNRIPSELIVGPNPTADDDNQLRLEEDEIRVPDTMQWIVDFDKAVENGMGFRIQLSAAQARLGFDRLFVLGVRLSSDEIMSAELLENLIHDHQRSRKGFSLLPQGAPTNNVEDEASAYSWRSDSDLSYDHFFKQDHTDDPTDWRRKKDGRWLSEYLGIDAHVMKASPNYFGTDQCEVRAMHEALWPATLGYFMEKMMTPVFSSNIISSTRAYFNRYVLGRGSIPAIRIGRQPYGILPVTPFSRMAWLRRKIIADDRRNTGIPNPLNFLTGLYQVLQKADQTWTALSDAVSYVGKPQMDPHQALLDVVGLHPTSVEYYQRYAESAEQLYNRFKLSGVWGQFLAAIVTLGYVQSGMNLLSELGYSAGEEDEIPEILNKFFLKSPNLLKGPFVDDQPLSETDALRAHHTDGSNYLEWLIAAARESHDALRKQIGFIDDRPPTALLYLMLRHAIDVGYVETSLELHRRAELLTASQISEIRRPLKFMHIEEAPTDKGSEWQYLYKAEPAITNQPELRIAEFIPQILTLHNPYLNTQLEALEHLKQIPTARLERAFAEHLDCCTSRFDAWLLGLLNVQLTLMRQPVDGSSTEDPDDDHVRGLYLGAFGWLEDVKSENKRLQPVTLEGDLDAIFNKETDSPLFEDASNFGYIHAPSLNHAVTAAVLRNGYLSNATPQNPESLSINLTSERVRLAMNVIQGMRNGQSLSALLGYYLERGLHDQADLFLDSLIFELRKQFPLAGNRLKPTRDTNVSIEAVEARNVVDGLALVEHVQQLPEEDQTYPFGLEDKLPSLTDPLAVAAVNKEVDKIRNINDAVADLAMAEGVYQVAQGNYDRAAGTLDAYSKAHFPPIPEVVQTPRSGVTLTHRVAIHLQGGLDPSDPVHTTPRSKAEPAVNAWLADELPPMDSLFCVAEFFNHTADEMQTPEVTAADLELQAVDLLYMLDTDGEQQMRALEDQLLLHVLKVPGVRADAEVKIHYRAKRPGKISFFEIEPYLSNLRALLLRSRELKSTDARLPNEAAAAEDDTASIRVEKVELVRDMLDTLNDDLGNLVTQFGSLLDLPDEDDVTQNAIDEIDNLIGAYSETAGGMGLFGLPNTGVSFAYDWRRRQFSSLVGKLSTLIESWDAKVADFEQRLLDYSALPASTSDTKKMTLLLQAAMLITTEAVMPPASQDPNDLLDTLNADLKPPFEAALQEMISIRDTEMELSSLYKRLADMTASITKHDTEPFDVSDNQQAIVTFAKSLQSKTDKLSTEITHHLADVDALIAGDPETDSTGRIEELRSAAKKMLGEDFVILPEFSLTADHEAEWLAAYNDQSALMTYLKTDLSVDFPEDDWLYGVARVREKMHHFESAVIFSEAFGGAALKLTPLQFPRRENDLWLGLDIPEKIPGTEDSWVIEEDKLLYTAHYSVDFNSSSGLHCGVLLDEWTEVIPTKDETTGLAFHYDRPNSEPAQTMLLALPADFTGSWKWQDLVDAMHETLDLARKRAVEPQHLDNTSYSRFLPAVVSSVTRFPIALALDFAFNNAVQFQSEVD